jgi:flagellar capping protein FliD
MTADKFRSDLIAGRPSVRAGAATESLSAVTQRLAKAEAELQVQFTRIAQLQAQLDLVLARLRRLTEGSHRR